MNEHNQVVQQAMTLVIISKLAWGWGPMQIVDMHSTGTIEQTSIYLARPTRKQCNNEKVVVWCAGGW